MIDNSFLFNFSFIDWYTGFIFTRDFDAETIELKKEHSFLIEDMIRGNRVLVLTISNYSCLEDLITPYNYLEFVFMISDRWVSGFLYICLNRNKKQRMRCLQQLFLQEGIRHYLMIMNRKD